MNHGVHFFPWDLQASWFHFSSTKLKGSLIAETNGFVCSTFSLTASKFTITHPVQSLPSLCAGFLQPDPNDLFALCVFVCWDLRTTLNSAQELFAQEWALRLLGRPFLVQGLANMAAYKASVLNSCLVSVVPTWSFFEPLLGKNWPPS